jgi:general secretion pathway protein J
MKRAAGFTLLEILIAITLLSLLSTGALLSMRMGLNALGRTNDRLISNRRVVGAQQILEQQLEGFMPVMAQCGGGKIPFFLGQPQSMRFVSSYSLDEASRGHPRVLEFQVIPGERGEGVRLIVNEHLYAGPASVGPLCPGASAFQSTEVGPQSFVLADRLASCRFIYQTDRPGPIEWRGLWDVPKWPRAVKVEMVPLDDAGARLRPLTVTALIRVDRYTNFPYDDYAR